MNDSAADLAAGRALSTWAFIVEPVGSRSSRLIVRSRARSAMTRIQGPVQFVMPRRSMLGIKGRAEGTSPSWTADVLEPLLWLLAAGVSSSLRSGPSLSPSGGGSRSPWRRPRSRSCSNWPSGSRP